MTAITITMNLDDEHADPGHPVAVTEEGYDLITAALSQFGTNILIHRAEPA